MLRVEQFRLARREVEEVGIKLVSLRNDRVGLHVARVRKQRGIDAGVDEFLVGEECDRLHAIAKIPPEGIRARRTWKPAGHTDDGDVPGPGRAR